MYQLKLSLCVLSAFESMGLPVASLLSVKRVSLSLQLPRNHLRSKLLSNTGWFSTTLLCRLCNQHITTGDHHREFVAILGLPRHPLGPKHYIPNLPSLCL